MIKSGNTNQLGETGAKKGLKIKRFLSEMDLVVPSEQLVEEAKPYYKKE